MNFVEVFCVRIAFPFGNNASRATICGQKTYLYSATPINKVDVTNDTSHQIRKGSWASNLSDVAGSSQGIASPIQYWVKWQRFAPQGEQSGPRCCDPDLATDQMGLPQE